MLYLRAFAQLTLADRAVAELSALPEVRHVMRQPSADGREVMISADLHPVGVDDALTALLALGLGPEDVTVERSNAIGPIERRSQWLAHRSDAMVWTEVVEGARENARLPARYLVFMAVAGVLAGIAVILQNSVLLVGAMAVSPDLLPITAACVGIIGSRWRLTGRAVGTLALGLTTAIFTAWLVTWFLDVTGFFQHATLPNGGTLILPTNNWATTIIVALVAGIAGMIAAETRASAAVGVAISVTTIPAAAYTGVALMIGDSTEALTGIAVLTVNVAMLLIGGTLALLIQRWLHRRGRRMERAVTDGVPSS
jgi:uncharacterized hydrophobic protein (TIGR00271 family)